MQQNSNGKKQPKKPENRDDRLKAALKANMARRKAQAKARAGVDTPAGGSAENGQADKGQD